jgi:nucleotide-binding universal stress UspA family protein
MRTRLVRGHPHDALIRAARAAHADLLVVGRHGRSRFGAEGLGSVAGRLVRTSPTPLLIVARAALQPYQNAVAAADLSASCRRALHALRRVLGSDVGGRVTVFHVDDSPFEDALVLGGATLRELRRFRREHQARTTASLKALIAAVAPPAGKWRLIQRQGEPRQEVLDFARSSGADLLALGTHGRSGLSRALLGSVAETVVRAAGVDTLIASAKG